jgi:hypothetical protein
MSVATAAEPLAPAYPHWPEERAECVSVLCEGPSIELVTPGDLLPGPVVAVNHALSLSGKFPVDFWATVDNPKNLWDWGAPYLHERCKIFTTDNNTFILDGMIEDAIAERVYALKPTFMEATEEHPAFLSDDGKPALLSTLTHVLGWLYHIGVPHVRVYGADMRGSGSPLAFTPFSEAEDVGWQFRWGVERRLFDLASDKYRSCGRRLDRWAPPSSSTKSK